MQKNCSLRLKHTDPVFRLKRTGKNLLSSGEYADNLIKYLGCARKTGTLSVNDLSDAIKKITGVSQIASNDSSNSDIDDSFPAPGEHVIVFWIESLKDIVWYLGIVDFVTEEKEARIIQLKRTDKKGQHWNIPEESDIWAVNDDQIIARNIDVIYRGASLNRIEISYSEISY